MLVVALGAWRLVLGVWCLPLGLWRSVLGVWLLVLGVWLLVLGSWFLVLGAWCLVLGVWCWLDDADQDWCPSRFGALENAPVPDFFISGPKVTIFVLRITTRDIWLRFLLFGLRNCY